MMLVWSSSDEKVIRVDQEGNTVSKNPGTAYITAKIEGTDFSSSVMVTVSNGYKDKKREAEETHICNNNIYFGSTRGSNIFDIGYYE